MRITVEFYGVLSQLMATERIVLDTPARNVADLLVQLGRDNPQLLPQLPRLACAVESTLVPAHHPLSEGSTLALIPPVSGGCR